MHLILWSVGFFLMYFLCRRASSIKVFFFLFTMQISFLLKMEQKSWQKQSSHSGKINSVRSVSACTRRSVAWNSLKVFVCKYSTRWSIRSNADHNWSLGLTSMNFISRFIAFVSDAMLRFIVEWNTNSKNCHVAQSGKVKPSHSLLGLTSNFSLKHHFITHLESDKNQRIYQSRR